MVADQRLGSGSCFGGFPGVFVEKRFHEGGGWSDDVVTFYVSSISQDFPRGLQRSPENSGLKIAAAVRTIPAGFDLG